MRQEDSLVMYAPPGRLRRYDLILIDEASQIEDGVCHRLRMAITELPQKPFVVVAADFRQLNPIGGGQETLKWCITMPRHHLTEAHRTKDPALLTFLSCIRLEQPSKSVVHEFFRGRHLHCGLKRAVAFGLQLQKTKGPHFGKHFLWLCVTNKGAAEINSAALELRGVTRAQIDAAWPGDPNVVSCNIFPSAGLMVRLTRNLDKERGFVNGAIGEIVTVLTANVFTVRLTSGTMCLVHPIHVDGRTFLPCCYGYATTIRRAQGSTLHLGCLYFDHCFPPERGYGYVGASRFRTSSGVFHYGRIRRTDWLPVGAATADQQLCRTIESQSEDSNGEGDRDSESASDGTPRANAWDGESTDDERSDAGSESSDEEDAMDGELCDSTAEGRGGFSDAALAAIYAQDTTDLDGLVFGSD
jgi:hypothetical protein